MQQQIRVISAAAHLVSDDLALMNGDRFRFVGRSKSPQKVDLAAVAGQNDPVRNPDYAHKLLLARYPPEEQAYPHDGDHRYLLHQLRRGALIPCDEFTANAAKVPFGKGARSSKAKPAGDDKGADVAQKGKGA